MMQEDQKIRDIATQIVKDHFHESQFDVGPIPYHAHTGVDSPNIDGANLIGAVLARVTSLTTTGTPTPPGIGTDLFEITGATGAVAFQPPKGKPANASLLRLRVTSSTGATARALSFATGAGGYIAGTPPFPSATVTGQTTSMGFEYDTGRSLNKWRLLWVASS